MDNDLYSHILHTHTEKLEDLHKDIREIKDLMCTVKTEQAKCDSRWSMLTKITSFIISGLGLSGIITMVNGWIVHK